MWGHRLTPGMEFEIDAAQAYASAAVGDIDFEKLFHETSEKYNEYRLRIIFSAAREGGKYQSNHLSASEHAESLIALKKYMFELERKYRHRFDTQTAFKIEVLRPDLMPEQIGLCRYESSL